VDGLELPSHAGSRHVKSSLAWVLAIVLVMSGCASGSRNSTDIAPSYREPVKLSSANGVLEVRLTARASEARLNTVARPVTGMLLYDWRLVRGTSSDGKTSGEHSYPAPTLAVQPGEKLVIHMSNGLHRLKIPDFIDPVLTPADAAVPLVPAPATSVPINLHTHGLHVSPNLNADNVLLEIPAGMGNTYTYDIPADHPQGVYWYHPHRHQLTESQVYRGLAGLIEIGRPEGDLRKVSDNNLTVRIMALQMNFVPNRAGGQHYLGYMAWPQMLNTKADPAPGALADGSYQPLLTPVNFPDSAPGTTFKTNWFSGPLVPQNKRGAFQFMPQNLIDFVGDDPSVTSPADLSYPDHLRDIQLTVNGQFQPVIEAAPGQTEVWNLANIGSQAYMNIGIRDTATKELVPLRVLGRDGDPDPAVGTGMARGGTTYLLAPASRVTLAVTMPQAGGVELVLPPLEGPDAKHTQPLSTRGILYTNTGDNKVAGQLGTVSVDLANFNWLDGFKSTPVQTLAAVRLKGAPVASVSFTPGEPLTDHSPFVDTSAMTVAERRVFTIGGGASPRVNPDDPNGFMYMFNKTTWPTTPVIHPRLNSVEEWHFINTNNDQHPIHVHVNDFQVMDRIDPVTGVNSGAQPHAYDNFNVPAPLLDSEEQATEAGEMTIRSLFQDFTGTFVTHCHRLDHEDNGLMMTINVIPEVSTYAVATQQGQAPAVVEVRDQANDAVVERVTPFPDSRALPNVTMADVDGDQVLDLLAGSGPGDRAEVVAFSGAEGTFTRELARFSVFDDDFRGGVNVAAGHIAGSPLASNIVVSSGPGRDNEVVVYSNELPSARGSAPEVFSSFEPHPGQDGSVLAAGLTDPMGRVSIITAPTNGARIRVFNYPLLTVDDGTHHSGDSHGGDGPQLVTEFTAFDDYDGPMSLTTGWIAANEGGAESIITGQRNGQGLVRSFSSGSQLAGQSGMYVEPFDHQMTVEFTPTMTFQPFGSGVTVATTSTTSGAKILAFGSQSGTSAMKSFNVERSSREPASLRPVGAGVVSFPGVGNGSVGGD
jgi:FtsP/CotA-like multicopper oxidase with cupredoxin domain